MIDERVSEMTAVGAGGLNGGRFHLKGEENPHLQAGRKKLRRARAGAASVTTQTRRGALLRTAAGLLFIGFVTALFLMLTLRVFGFVFVPSVTWTEAARPFGVGAGLVLASIALLLHIVTWRKIKAAPPMKLLMIPLIPLLAYSGAYSLTVIAPAMVSTAMFGHEVDLDYTVRSGVHDGSRRCRSSINLEGPPLGWYKLCGIQAGDIRGATVRVSGRGNDHGVWAGDVRIMP